MKLTFLQAAWVWSRGGRTAKDVFVRDGELCILMFNGKEMVPYGIPGEGYMDLCMDYLRRFREVYDEEK